MTYHTFVPEILHNTIGWHEPAMFIDDGDTVSAETVDAHGYDRHGNQPGTRPNPMTGPFHVRGAEPGDALKIRIERITMTRSSGWTFHSLAANVVDPGAVRRLPPPEKTLWIIDSDAAAARLAEPPPRLADFVIPLDPMIGCFGVAPALHQAWSTATSGPYGGNMDYRGFRAGAEVMFPVSAPGGLFFLGDVHAAQGDGEIVGTGIETSAEVTFTVTVVKNRRIGWPRGETREEIFTVGNARPLDQALQHATTEMLDWLIEDFGHDPVSASHLMGMAVRYDIANVFNPNYSVACRVAKSWL
jgi:acetamidase/formamidase